MCMVKPACFDSRWNHGFSSLWRCGQRVSVRRIQESCAELMPRADQCEHSNTFHAPKQAGP